MATLRKVCALKMLSSTTLNSVYQLRWSMVRRAIRHIYERARNPLNIGDQVFTMAFNVITSMIWGNTIRGQEVERLGAESREIVTETAFPSIKPNISDFFLELARFDLQGIERRTRALLAKFDRLFGKVVNERLKLDKDGADNMGHGHSGQDFLQYLLRLKEEGDADVQETPFTMIQLKALLIVG